MRSSLQSPLSIHCLRIDEDERMSLAQLELDTTSLRARLFYAVCLLLGRCLPLPATGVSTAAPSDEVLLLCRLCRYHCLRQSRRWSQWSHWSHPHPRERRRWLPSARRPMVVPPRCDATCSQDVSSHLHVCLGTGRGT